MVTNIDGLGFFRWIDPKAFRWIDPKALVLGLGQLILKAMLHVSFFKTQIR